MTILGYEQPVEMPTMDIYSTDLMKAYIAGVKEQYDNAREDLKDFLKTYGDFQSAVPGATEAYYQLGPGRVQSAVNDLYARGIDPLRSVEGQQYIAQLIASTNTSAMKQLERQSKDYDAYRNNLAEMIAKGLTTKEAEDWMLRNQGLDKFQATSVDANGNVIVNPWTRPVADMYKSINDLTKSEFDELEATEYLKPSTRAGFDIMGVSEDTKNRAVDSSIEILKSNPFYGMFRERAEKLTALKTGGQYTQSDVDNTLREMVIQENINYLQPKEVENAVKVDAIRTQNDIRAHSINAATDYYYKQQWAKNPLNPDDRKETDSNISYIDLVNYTTDENNKHVTTQQRNRFLRDGNNRVYGYVDKEGNYYVRDDHGSLNFKSAKDGYIYKFRKGGAADMQAAAILKSNATKNPKKAMKTLAIVDESDARKLWSGEQMVDDQYFIKPENYNRIRSIEYVGSKLAGVNIKPYTKTQSEIERILKDRSNIAAVKFVSDGNVIRGILNDGTVGYYETGTTTFSIDNGERDSQGKPKYTTKSYKTANILTEGRFNESSEFMPYPKYNIPTITSDNSLSKPLNQK